MGRPDDANPLHASLAAEVIRRQPKAQKKENSAETPVTVDRKAILALNASQRQKWLSKALRQAVDGRLSAPQLYDVVSAAKFADGIEDKVGRRMCHWLKEHLTLFTNRQQRHLQESAAIFTKFRPRSESDGEQVRQREPSEPRAEEGDVASRRAAAATETSEDMMSRIREFMRGKAHERDRVDIAAGPSKAERRAAQAFLDEASDEPTSKLNGGKMQDVAAEAQQPLAATRSSSAPRRRAGSRSESRSRSRRRRVRRTPSRSGSSRSSAGQRRGRSRSQSPREKKAGGERRSRSCSRSGSWQQRSEEKRPGGEKPACSTNSRRRTHTENRVSPSEDREGAWSKRRKDRSASSRSRSLPSRRGRRKREKDKGRDKARERGRDKDRR